MTQGPPFSRCQAPAPMYEGTSDAKVKVTVLFFFKEKNSMFFSCFTAEKFWLKFSKRFLHEANAMHGKFQPK